MLRATPCLLTLAVLVSSIEAFAVDDSSPLVEKARYLEQDLKEKHSLDGLYVSIVPSAPPGTVLPHTVDQPGNVIHAGVWTGRYLAGIGYQYAVTRDPEVRRHGGQILMALRRLQEVTGKPGLLARGYVTGHGPVMGWEREGADSKEWHQGQGEYADYRWYGDVSVDNFNAVLYGYAIYFDLAADESQRRMIAEDADRLMTHLLDNHCRIVDVDGEVTQWGHVGVDPDPARAEYYEKLYAGRPRYPGAPSIDKLPLRACLMLLPDLLIAHHVTGKDRYREFYDRVVARYQDNPELPRPMADSPEAIARTNHSSEGQAFEAMYNLIRYETSPELLSRYRRWVTDLWERNWNEGNSLFTYMTLSLLPEYRTPKDPSSAAPQPPQDLSAVPHGAEALTLANHTLELYPVDRVLRPVMNSLRADVSKVALSSRHGRQLSQNPLPINERPLDNEYAWKGNPYELDGWLKPHITSVAFACDDPQVAWCVDSAGRLFMTRDRGELWTDMTPNLMGGAVQQIVASSTRTFVIWAKTSAGLMISRDGGMSLRPADMNGVPQFSTTDPRQWQKVSENLAVKIDERDQLVRSNDNGATSQPAMDGWRIPIGRTLFVTPWGIIAGGPGGTYLSTDAQAWKELTIWPELETGAADFLHAYWMGRYFGFVENDEP